MVTLSVGDDIYYPVDAATCTSDANCENNVFCFDDEDFLSLHSVTSFFIRFKFGIATVRWHYRRDSNVFLISVLILPDC